MDNKGLLFIPDISGFTEFVSHTDIEHSRLIIQELLEILINANEIGLEVSEIEGDAILFYKFGDSPDLKELYKQVEKMFTDFHRYLNGYDLYKFCQCKACLSAINLTLKVVTHYGEFTGYNVRNFNKLIGKDVIVAHQLLKNDIDKHEYWLVTKELLRNDAPADFTQWMQWKTSTRQTENGEIAFHYTQLGQLKEQVPIDPPLQLELAEKTKVLSVTREYSTDIITLFHATGDVSYRKQWQEGVKNIEELNHFLPRVGMKYKSIRDSGEEIIYASSFVFNPERIVFSETDEKKKNANYFIMEQKDQGKIKLTWDYYIEKNIAKEIFFRLFGKKKMEKEAILSLEKLDSVVKSIHLPG